MANRKNTTQEWRNTIARELKSGALPGELVGFGKEAATQAADFISNLLSGWDGKSPRLGFEDHHPAKGSAFTRLGVINPDSPFLLDSVSAEITASGYSILRLLHPVVRLAQGKTAKGAPVSIIYMELAGLAVDQVDPLRTRISDVLAAVRATVGGWQALMGEMRADSAAQANEESAELLSWFGGGQMTLLGHATFSRDGQMSDPKGLATLSGQKWLSQKARLGAFDALETSGRNLLLIKSNQLSPVHRRVPMDLVITRRTSARGDDQLSIHAGLWTSSALSSAPSDTPVLRQKLAALQARFGFNPTGHAGKALAHALTSLPHDILIALDQRNLEDLAQTAMSVIDRPRPVLAIAVSPLERHLEAFVWLPRDDLNTLRRVVIGEKIEAACQARILSWSMSLDDGGIALIRYTLDIRDGSPLPDVAALNGWLQDYLRGWQTAFESELKNSEIASRFGSAFPQDYRDRDGISEAVQDAPRLAGLTAAKPFAARIFERAGRLHLKLYALDPVELSIAVPVLENFGFTVLEEVPTTLGASLGTLHDFKLGLSDAQAQSALVSAPDLVERAVEDVLAGTIENDRFNALMSSASLDQQDVLLFRALFRYLRQTGMSYGLNTVVDAIRNAPSVAQALALLFANSHGPKSSNRKALAADEAVVSGLANVSAVDDDRILRLYRAIIRACLRTNFFVPAGREALAFKLDSAAVPGLPDPRPWREVFVYSPRVEGIHLRAGPVARGGLRWSDRRDDFRTEVLGLMKAQRVKNAVIVPTGAKGGFYPKQLPDPSQDRDGWAAEGKAAYQVFIRALLSITDNIVANNVVHPAGVKVTDGQDPYFVVAADKGTASFSDVANAIAAEHGFWLGDAFASGGSQGYDHKAMGITAKGAWVSVTRHFAEMGVDVQRDAVRIIGCGDMSGDVFGNGLLLSRSVQLIAAFDHRHIFFDPNPDAQKSWAERARLFALPRSSWEDYDSKLISKGGGVFSRSAKTIKLTAEMQAALGMVDGELEPAQVISAILSAEADLIWFGGIGTYVKAKAESNAEVGDRANDAIRINASELRAKVIGEGANLGMTQAARIEFAAYGGRVNTDFIDNAAGVDCSDNEVNIKIALNGEVAAGRLKMPARNTLLQQMTDDVAELVLEDNRLQTLALSIAEREGANALPTQIRLIEKLESQGLLDRDVEGLTSNVDLFRRSNEGKGLTRPELAVIMATAKLALQDALEGSALAQDAAALPTLFAAFPAPMQKRFAPSIEQHRLRGEIIATKLANRIINRLGPVLPFELAEEEGCGLDDVAEAFVIAEQVLDLPVLWHALDTAAMPEPTRLMLFDQLSVEIRAHMADILRHAVDGRSNDVAVRAYMPSVQRLSKERAKLLSSEARAVTSAFEQRLIDQGTPKTIAASLVRLAELDGAIGLSSVSSELKADITETTRAFIMIGSALGIDWAQGVAMQMDPVDPWERLLTAGLSRDFQTMRLAFIAQHGGRKPEAAARKWLDQNAARVGAFRQMIDQARTSLATPAMLAQIAGQARMLLSR